MAQRPDEWHRRTRPHLATRPVESLAPYHGPYGIGYQAATSPTSPEDRPDQVTQTCIIMSPNTRKYNHRSSSNVARLLTLGNANAGQKIVDHYGKPYVVAADGSMRLHHPKPRNGRGKSIRRLMIKARRAEEFA